MKQLAQWVLAVAESIGGPGLFLIAFLDSSFLSFPQANDLLIVLKVAQHTALAIYYAALAPAGSKKELGLERFQTRSKGIKGRRSIFADRKFHGLGRALPGPQGEGNRKGYDPGVERWDRPVGNPEE